MERGDKRLTQTQSGNLMLELSDLGKRFKRNRLFRGVSFVLEGNGCAVVTGENGSGKSTLIKCMLGLLQPSEGEVAFNGVPIQKQMQDFQACVSLVAPYMSLFEELSAEENISLFAAAAGKPLSKAEIDAHLNDYQLAKKGSVMVRHFSSGMKQRLKYLVAMLKNPDCLFLDEPTANLDDEGKLLVKQFVARERGNRRIILATNEADEKLWGEACYEL